MTQYTLGGSFERSGVGLHTGILTKVRVMPAAPGEGRYFVRLDLVGAPVIPAAVDTVSETTLSTELCSSTQLPKVRVRTVEHLLAALACCGVDHARIEVDGSEIPLLDGSAKPWVEAINEVGVVVVEPESVGKLENTQQELAENGSLSCSCFVLPEAVWVYKGDSFVAALPAPRIRFTYGIEFDLPAIGNQWYSWAPSQESFAEAIAPARTFGLASQIDQLRERGLIKGGSLENALVCDRKGWLNPPLRFSNEPVRHKLLDLVGDLSLLGSFPIAHFLAYKASHNLHIQLARQLAGAK